MDWRWLAVIPVSVGLGALLNYLHVSAPWIVAGILTAGAASLLTHRELVMNTTVERSARGAIGVLAGLSLVGVDWGVLLHYIIPGIVLSLLTIAISFGSGILLAHRDKEVSTQTGILSMLPGGSSTMPIIAKETGADFRLVSLIQYLRLLLVSLSLPILGAYFYGGPIGHGAHHPSPELIPTLALMAIAILGPWLGKLAHIPVPHIFTPLILTPAIAALFDASATFILPEPIRIAALLAIGWMCGGGLSVPALKLFARQLPLTVTIIFATIGVCAATAILLQHWVGITYFEAYLATSPGGLETVLALASEGGVGPVVVSVQIMRLIVIMTCAGFLPQIIRFIAGRMK